jgi:DNA-binding response OmpR family regulator
MDSRATVLIIEDSPVVQHLLRATLTPLGVGLLFASDGETGLDLARAHLPEMIILDIGLPGIDGWEVLGRLRSEPPTAPMGVLVLTAHAQESMRQAAVDLGADGFMTKPFRPDELRRAVDGLLERESAASVTR